MDSASALCQLLHQVVVELPMGSVLPRQMKNWAACCQLEFVVSCPLHSSLGISINSLPLPLPLPCASVFVLTDIFVDTCSVSNGIFASLEQLFSRCVGGGQAGGLGCLLPFEICWKGTSAAANSIPPAARRAATKLG